MSKILPIGEIAASCTESVREQQNATANQISTHIKAIERLQTENAAIAAQILALTMKQKKKRR